MRKDALNKLGREVFFLDTDDCVEMQKRAGSVARHYFCHKTGDAASCNNHPAEGRGTVRPKNIDPSTKDYPWFIAAKCGRCIIYYLNNKYSLKCELKCNRFFNFD